MLIEEKMENKTRKIRLTNKELIWIERTADIESAMALNKFLSIVHTDMSKLDEKEKEMIKKISSELIELYIFLKELRIKLELWDCRYDVDAEIPIEEKHE